MKEIEKTGKSEPLPGQTTSELYERVMKSRTNPRYANKAEALAGTREELNALAQKMGLSVEELLVKAESSPIFREEYVEALMLARRINYFKK